MNDDDLAKATAAVQANLKDPQAWLNLGQLLQIKGETGKAERCFQQVKKLTEATLAASSQQVPQPTDNDLKRAKAAVQSNPKESQAWMRFGQLLQVKGETDKANFCFQNAQKLLEINRQSKALVVAPGSSNLVLSEASTEVITFPGSDRIVLTDIDPTAFQHSLDRQATEQLKKIKGFDQLVAKFIELGYERFDYVFNVGGSVRVGPEQLPQIYEMLLECCTILAVPEPELYVSHGDVNALTSGHNNPYIILQSGLLELMNDDEIMAVIAHELGHIKCGHVLYKVMARSIGHFIEQAGKLTFGIGATVGTVLSAGIQLSLLTWDRYSEFTADRAALLVMQDTRPCISMLMKLASGHSRFTTQLNIEAFLEQAHTYDDMGQSMGDRAYRFLSAVGQTHPFVVERAKALYKWIDGPGFEQILAGNYPRLSREVQDQTQTKTGTYITKTIKEQGGKAAGAGLSLAKTLKSKTENIGDQVKKSRFPWRGRGESDESPTSDEGA